MTVKNKTCLITGAARGMGLVTARALAEQGIEKLILVDWEGEAGTRARDEINAITGKQTAEFIFCDLSSQQQVRTLAADINARYEALHILVNNAGITDPVRRVSVDGFEMHVATCHFAHFILTNLLLDLMKRSAPARIINISSDAHKAGPGVDLDDFNNEKIWKGKPVSNNAAFQAYHRAKLCNIYMMQELAPRLAPFDITINAVSPGYFINTTIHRNMTGIFKLGAWFVFGFGTLFGLNTPEKGARSHIYLASSEQAEGVTGKYFEHAKEKAMGKPAFDDEMRARVWSLSEELTDTNYDEVAPKQ